MSTITVNSSGVGWCYSGYASWYRDYAFQGRYRGQNVRIGTIMFSTLRNNVRWQDMVVTGVTLKIQFSDAGSAVQKTMGIYASTRNSISGYANSMIGESIGQVITPHQGWGNLETFTFNSSYNAAAFTKIASWIENGNSNGLVFYMNEDVTSTTRDYSANYASMTSGSLIIDYVVKGSSGTLDKSQVEVGEDITLSITPITSEYPVSHTVQYRCGSEESQVYTLQAGVNQHTYTIPNSWLSELSGVKSTQAYCTLTTYENNESKGSKTYEFTANVPARYTPTLTTFNVKRYITTTDDHGQTIYVASLSGPNVWINLDCSIDRDSGLNPGTASIKYYKDGDEENAQTVNLTWNSDNLVLTEDRTIITQTISVLDGWVFELTLSNGHENIVSTARVERAWAPFHVAGTGYGIGIGMYSTGVLADPRLEVAWPAHLLGGVRDFGGSIQCGITNDISTTAGSYQDLAIVFDVEYDSAPLIVVGFCNDSTSGQFGKCCCAVLYGSVTTTGFTVRIHNGDIDTRAPKVTWIAIGQVTPSI